MKNIVILLIVGLSLAAMATVLPFSETFDSLVLGSVDGQEDWSLLSGTALVQTNTAAAGSKSLEIQSGSVSHSLSSGESSVWVRFQAKLAGKPTADYTAPDSSTSAAFFINTNLNLVVYSNQNPIVLSGAVPTNVWLQFDMYCDYTNMRWSLGVNGTNVAANLGFYSTSSQVAGVHLANSGSASVYIDELSVADVEPSFATPDTDGDGIPDWWELRYYGGITNATASGLATNGLSNFDSYVAGLSPSDPEDRLDMQRRGERKFGWSRKPGREYDIYWTTNLLSGFARIYTNITAEEFEDTDNARIEKGSGFYQIRVRK